MQEPSHQPTSQASNQPKLNRLLKNDPGNSCAKALTEHQAIGRLPGMVPGHDRKPELAIHPPACCLHFQPKSLTGLGLDPCQESACLWKMKCRLKQRLPKDTLIIPAAPKLVSIILPAAASPWAFSPRLGCDLTPDLSK